MGDHPLRPPTRRSLGGPLPRQLANGTRAHPRTINISAVSHAENSQHPVLDQVSLDYSGFGGRLLTCYSPLRHWFPKEPVRLACLIHAASVHSEPGSNSPLQKSLTAPEGALILLQSSTSRGGRTPLTRNPFLLRDNRIILRCSVAKELFAFLRASHYFTTVSAFRKPHP